MAHDGETYDVRHAFFDERGRLYIWSNDDRIRCMIKRGIVEEVRVEDLEEADRKRLKESGLPDGPIYLQIRQIRPTDDVDPPCPPPPAFKPWCEKE